MSRLNEEHFHELIGRLGGNVSALAPTRSVNRSAEINFIERRRRRPASAFCSRRLAQAATQPGRFLPKDTCCKTNPQHAPTCANMRQHAPPSPTITHHHPNSLRARHRHSQERGLSGPACRAAPARLRRGGRYRTGSLRGRRFDGLFPSAFQCVILDRPKYNWESMRQCFRHRPRALGVSAGSDRLHRRARTKANVRDVHIAELRKLRPEQHGSSPKETLLEEPRNTAHRTTGARPSALAYRRMTPIPYGVPSDPPGMRSRYAECRRLNHLSEFNERNRSCLL